jgi:hypothetical protein
VLSRWAFPAPLPALRLARVLAAGLAMAVVVHAIDSVLDVSAPVALAVLIPSGIAAYAAMCWLQNVAHIRDRALAALKG